MTPHFGATKSRIINFFKIITHMKIIMSTSMMKMLIIIFMHTIEQLYKLMIKNVNIYCLKFIFTLMIIL